MYEKDLKDPKRRNSLLNEIYTIRIYETNYCPQKCSFCSCTNFHKHASGGITARISSLSPESLIKLIENAYSAYPELRTVSLGSDNFLHGIEKKEGIKIFAHLLNKKMGNTIPSNLVIICQARADDITPEILESLKKARVIAIGFGIESFSDRMLKEFNKKIDSETMKKAIELTLDAGISPFLNLILTSKNSQINDIFTTVDLSIKYMRKGARAYISDYLIPLPGSEICKNVNKKNILYEDLEIPFTNRKLRRATKIIPKDPAVRKMMKRFENEYEDYREEFIRKNNITDKLDTQGTLLKFQFLYTIAKDMNIPGISISAQSKINKLNLLL